MGNRSAIQWTDTTWNPVTGCTRVSPGCDNCYAARAAATRLKYTPQYQGLAVVTPSGRAAFNGTVRLLPERLEQPLRWRRPRRVFVNSMSDLFHEGIPDEFIDRVFAVMAEAVRHQFQVLTKRPERMRSLVPLFAAEHTAPDGSGWPLPNVALGVSCENQETADERIPLLLQTPAAVRFLSCEPLLGPITFRWASWHPYYPEGWRERGESQGHLDGLKGLHWIIVGGESGPGARAMDVQWMREIVAQCREADVPVFVKQLGAQPIGWGRYPATRHLGEAGVLRLEDRKGGDISEWPEDLRIREWPRSYARVVA